MKKPKYKRIMLKISGEALAGDKGFGLDQPTINAIAEKIKDCSDMGVEIAVVVGGGNFWRGRTGEGMDRSRADHMEVVVTKADYTIVSFKMVDKPKANKESDYMQFTFTNMKRNTAIDDSVFKVQ